MQPLQNHKFSTYEEAHAEYDRFDIGKTFITQLVAFIAGLLSATFAYRPVFIWMVNKLSDTNVVTAQTASKVDHHSPYKDKNIAVKEQEIKNSPFPDVIVRPRGVQLSIGNLAYLFDKSSVHVLDDDEYDDFVSKAKVGDYFISQKPGMDAFEISIILPSRNLDTKSEIYVINVDGDKVRFEQEYTSSVENLSDFKEFLDSKRAKNLLIPQKKEVPSEPSKTLENLIKDKIITVGVKESNKILANHEEGTCLIRPLGKGYILDLVTAPKRVQHFVFSIEDDLIKDEMNRSFTSIDEFFRAIGAKAFLTLPPK